MELNGTKSILLQEREVGPERMVTSQVSGESLGETSKCSWLCTLKNLRASHSKVKADLFREIYTP